MGFSLVPIGLNTVLYFFDMKLFVSSTFPDLWSQFTHLRSTRFYSICVYMLCVLQGVGMYYILINPLQIENLLNNVLEVKNRMVVWEQDECGYKLFTGDCVTGSCGSMPLLSIRVSSVYH